VKKRPVGALQVEKELINKRVGQSDIRKREYATVGKGKRKGSGGGVRELRELRVGPYYL